MRRLLIPAFLLVGMGRLALRAAPINLSRQKAASVASPIPIRASAARQMVTVPVAAATLSGLPFQEMATATITKPNPPRTKAEAQAVLKHFGFAGLSISGIDVGFEDEEIARVYVLTRKQLQENNTMVRKAQTVVITMDDDEVRARAYNGWLVGDLPVGGHGRTA